MLNEMIIKQFDVNIEITCFEHAEDAIQILDNKAFWPDVIFLDINMPVMNAWDFLDNAKEVFLQQGDHPIIHILTSSNNPEDNRKAQTYIEVSEYLIKPLNAESLKKTLEK
jgi:CheY-like chemotaxis protein